MVSDQIEPVSHDGTVGTVPTGQKDCGSSPFQTARYLLVRKIADLVHFRPDPDPAYKQVRLYKFSYHSVMVPYLPNNCMYWYFRVPVDRYLTGTRVPTILIKYTRKTYRYLQDEKFARYQYTVPYLPKCLVQLHKLRFQSCETAVKRYGSSSLDRFCCFQLLSVIMAHATYLPSFYLHYIQPDSCYVFFHTLLLYILDLLLQIFRQVPQAPTVPYLPTYFLQRYTYV